MTGGVAHLGVVARGTNGHRTVGGVGRAATTGKATTSSCLPLGVDLPRNPFDEHMGYRVVSLDEDHAVLEADTGAAFHNPVGITHGSFYCGIMESSMGFLVHSHNRDKMCTNVDLQVSFARATKVGKLRATASVLKRGRRAWLLESVVEDDGGRMVAKARSTFLVLDPDGE